MPKRRFRPVRRRRYPGPLAWAGFAGGVTMGALAATLIAGSDEQPPPPTTQLAAGELPEALKNLVAEYLDEEGYRPAEPAPPPPPPAPAELPPAPAPAVPVPVPVPVAVAPVSTRTGSEVWPVEMVEIVPEPIAPPAQISPPVVQAVAPVLPQAEAEPVAVAAQPEVEPVADAQPEPVMAEEPVTFETRESVVAPEEDTTPIIRHAEAAPEPEISAPTIAEVSSADAIVVPAEPEVEGRTE